VFISLVTDGRTDGPTDIMSIRLPVWSGEGIKTKIIISVPKFEKSSANGLDTSRNTLLWSKNVFKQDVCVRYSTKEKLQVGGIVLLKNILATSLDFTIRKIVQKSDWPDFLLGLMYSDIKQIGQSNRVFF